MAIAFRSAATAANGAAPTSVTVSKPAGVVDGDVLVAFVAISADQTIVAAPSGWTQLDSRSTGTASGDTRHAVWYRVASSEPASYVWDFSAGADCAAVIVAYSGVSTGGPIAVSGARLMSSSTLTHVAPSVTPPSADTVTISAFGVNPFFNGDTTLSTPSGLTARGEADPGAGTTNRAVLKVFDKSTATADPTGDNSTTLNNSSKGLAYTVTLAPLAAAAQVLTVQPYRVVATATGCMIGWYDGNGYTGANGLQDMEALLDTTFAAVRVYNQWWPDVASLVTTATNDGRLVVSSHKPPKVANAWIAIANGDHDAEIAAMAAFYKALDSDVVFIFSHEPHGNASDVGSKSPSYGKSTDFVKAFRRIAQAFRDINATNVKIAYCAVDSRAALYPNDKLYPGDDWVDVLAHDIYNWGGYPGFSAWKDPDELFPAFVDIAKATNKPLLFGEIGCHPDSGAHDRGQWIRDMADLFKTGDAATYILGFCYYNVDDHDGSGHFWRFAQGTTADAKADFIDAISHDSHFLSAPITPSLQQATADPGDLGEQNPSGGTPPKVQGLNWSRKTTVAGIPTDLSEASGAAASPKGGLWVIRDSGNPASLYWLTQTSRGVFASHEVPVTGATNADWEDCCYAVESGTAYVYIHDNRDGNATGANPKRLYKVTEPATPAAASAATLVGTYHWKFPDSASSSTCGTKQNCEAIAVFRGVLYAVQKTDATEAEVYQIGAIGSLSTDQASPTIGTKIGTIAQHCPSSFTISADGTSVIVVQHGSTKVFRGDGTGILSLLTGKNRKIFEDAPGGSGEGAEWWPYQSSDFVVLSEDRQTFDYDVSSGQVTTSGIAPTAAVGAPTVTMASGPILITSVGAIPAPGDYEDPEESPGLDIGTPTITFSAPTPDPGQPDTPDLEGTFEFSPPVAFDLPMILPNTRGIQFRSWRYYGGNPRGQSVLKTAGVYHTVTTPSQLDVDAADEFYAGGHIYTITADVAEALTAAGYGDNITPAPDPRKTWGYYSRFTWGELRGTTWGEL